MTKMRIPVRDGESLENNAAVSSIQELMFGTVLKADEEMPLLIDRNNHCVHVYLKSSSISAACPCCGIISGEVHCSNFRHPQWMPISGMTTYAHIELKRFRCCNNECVQKTFVEQLDNARKNQHRSDLVNLIVFAVSVFCSDIATSLICKEMGIMVSHDSANRIL